MLISSSITTHVAFRRRSTSAQGSGVLGIAVAGTRTVSTIDVGVSGTARNCRSETIVGYSGELGYNVHAGADLSLGHDTHVIRGRVGR